VILRLFILLLCFVSTSAWAQNGQQVDFNKLMEIPVFEDALDISQIPKIEDCKEHTIRAPKYNKCRNSTAIYARALANAQAANHPLMVVFGFDTCPPCAALDKSVFNPQTPMTNDKIVRYYSKTALNEYAATGKPLKIMVAFIHSKSKHGQKLAVDLGIKNPLRPPFILLIDPVTGAQHSESKARYCDWGAQFAADLEGIASIQTGDSNRPRLRC